MKKVFSFAAIAALTMFAASCGNGDAEAKRIADSTHMADSMAKIAMQAKADSTHKADSMKAINDAAETKRKADSAHMADSIAAAGTKKPTGGSKPKPKTTTTTPTPKVGGKRPGANK